MTSMIHGLDSSTARNKRSGWLPSFPPNLYHKGDDFLYVRIREYLRNFLVFYWLHSPKLLRHLPGYQGCQVFTGHLGIYRAFHTLATFRPFQLPTHIKQAFITINVA